MATITLEITIGKGEAQQARTIVIDPDELPLGFNEDLESAIESNKWRELNRVLAEFIGLAHAEVRQMTNRQFREVMTAIGEAAKEATTSPNGK